MKSKIREEMKNNRRNMTVEEVLLKSEQAQNLFLQSRQYNTAKSVMVYIPLGNEVNTSKIIEDAFKSGKNVLVPVTDSETYEISAYQITKDTEFEKGTFSVNEPKEKVFFDKNNIDVVLVPGIAFDRLGGRVGFGKGCYDKFLKGTKAVKIGFCYDFQLIDRIETSETDISMDYIITEKEFLRGNL